MIRKSILIFDLDGTLIYSKDANVEAYNMAFENNRLSKLPAEKVSSVFGVPAEQVIKKLYPEISSRKLAAVAKDQKKFVGKCLKLVKPLEGIAETIEALSHKYILVLISNNIHSNILKLAKAGGIDPKKFRIIIGEDDVKNPKPAPDGILQVRELINAPIEYMVGDTIYDLQFAKNARVRGVGVLSGIGTFEQLWAENPAHIISSVAELPNVL